MLLPRLLVFGRMPLASDQFLFSACTSDSANNEGVSHSIVARTRALRELPASKPKLEHCSSLTPPQNNTPNNTFVSIRDYRHGAMLLVEPTGCATSYKRV